jgi:hypothetical protein
LTAADRWRPRGRTLEAIAGLIAARGVVAAVPLERWRGRFGLAGPVDAAALTQARQLAAHVRRGAGRLPFLTKCLPQALALSQMLRRRQIAHNLIIAVRPDAARTGADDLHAWIELDGAIVLGDLPGPWLTVFTLP